ncbi:hypothetical protein DMUE_5713 [Dictyocoela muelleri]|nr:hypothetical protein DMUE_5713 [Dictyocoela muelleri]
MSIKFQRTKNFHENNKHKNSMFKLSAIYVIFFYFTGLHGAYSSYLLSDNDDFLIIRRNRTLTFGRQSIYVHKSNFETNFCESFVKQLLREKGIPSVIYLEYYDLPSHDGEFEDQYQLLIHEVFIDGPTRTSRKQADFFPNHILLHKSSMNYITTQSRLK